MTAVDAALLQRSKAFFTGGFLSSEYIHSWTEGFLFVLLSFAADAAVIAVSAGVTMWLLARLRVRPMACAVAGWLAALAPLLIVDALSYQVIRYLGDAFDFGLMFELTGRSVAEVMAVASTYLVLPSVLTGVALIVAAGIVWIVHLRSTESGKPWRPGRAGVALVAAPVIIGLISVGVANAASDTLADGLLRKPSGRLLASALNILTDVDRDGFGIGGQLSDPDPFNRAVFPYALDIPGDGIDEDGVGGDLPGLTPAYSEPAAANGRWSRRPDVVLVVLESFRADVVGARYGNQPITPVLDGLAARGVSSARAYSHNGYTAQSRYHLFSGSLAGVRDGRTLIDDFERNGYSVGYFSGQDESFGGPAYDVGFSRADVRFDARDDRAHRYSTSSTAGSLALPFSIVQARVAQFLESAARERPLFLYVNFHDTHFPYSHPGVQTITSAERLPRGRIAPEEREALWATYTNAAANVDRAIGAVISDVQRTRGAMPAVIVLSDHGESLFDQGFLGHGYALNDVQTRIPLIVANLPLVVHEPFGQSDLRDAIDAALRVDPNAEAIPRLAMDPDREVFQYLGTIDHPRQIALLGSTGRTIYDFRDRRVQINAGRWEAPSRLTEHDRDGFLRLVRQWERMRLARHTRGSDVGS